MRASLCVITKCVGQFSGEIEMMDVLLAEMTLGMGDKVYRVQCFEWGVIYISYALYAVWFNFIIFVKAVSVR